LEPSLSARNASAQAVLTWTRCPGPMGERLAGSFPTRRALDLAWEPHRARSDLRLDKTAVDLRDELSRRLNTLTVQAGEPGSLRGAGEAVHAPLCSVGDDGVLRVAHGVAMAQQSPRTGGVNHKRVAPV
jgi:hypothetical protein